MFVSLANILAVWWIWQCIYINSFCILFRI